ncbi:MAG TPA: xanthine dehydrogenase family protein molybdopterin-binding subunit [Candidatus Dormibacteraeota bacterium]|jgi:carbon-monoxide dehydrogenase large subunit
MAINRALGGAVPRREDPRLITGAGRFTDDVHLDGCLHAVFVRSTVAHARIAAIDRAAAATLPGVAGVFVAADLGVKARAQFPSPDEMARPALASEVVRFVGDAIAVVVAETREQAVDAANQVAVDYTPLEVIVEPGLAARRGSALVHEAKGDNIAFEFEIGANGALEGAEVVVHGRFVNQRLAAAPIEANCVVAEPDGAGGLRAWVSTQVPFRVRDDIAEALGLAESSVRVIAGDVGGGFGAKLPTYPEQAVVSALALKLGKPVRWFEYRSENLVAMSHGRGQVQHVSLGAMRDGKLVGLEADVVADAGAYPTLAIGQPMFTGPLSTGVYVIPRMRFHAVVAATNTAVMAAYRGAGRPEATSLIERAMDMLAVELRMDPAELRRRNMIPGPFPYTTPAGFTYDSGDYARALELALEASDYAGWRREQEARRARGDRMLLGIGLSSYVEITGILTPMEHGAVRVEKDGTVVIHAGTASSGQGHETAYAQIASAVLRVPIQVVRVAAADTGIVRSGDGTYGSRSLQLGGSAVRGACIALVERAREETARRLEADAGDIEHVAGGFAVKGAPGSAVTWAQLAAGAPLVAEEDFIQTDQTFPFGCHVAVVELDVETGDARVIRHVAVDDCGTILNPMLVEGQIHGGVAQGVAQALYEEFVYDPEGNPLTTSLIDYAMPTIGEIPAIETLHLETPSPHNPLGAKGVGESGTIGSTAAVQNAVIDAVSHLGVRHIDMPMHPMRVWEAIRAAQGG